MKSNEKRANEFVVGVSHMVVSECESILQTAEKQMAIFKHIPDGPRDKAKASKVIGSAISEEGIRAKMAELQKDPSLDGHILIFRY